MYKPATEHLLSHGAAQQMLPALQRPVPCSEQTQLGTAGARTIAKECAHFAILFLEMMLEAEIARYCVCSHVHQSCQHLLSTVL